MWPIWDRIKMIHSNMPPWANVTTGIMCLLSLILLIFIAGLMFFSSIKKKQKQVNKIIAYLFISAVSLVFFALVLSFLSSLFMGFGIIKGLVIFCLTVGWSFSAWFSFFIIIKKLSGEKFELKNFSLWSLFAIVCAYFLCIIIGDHFLQ